MKEQTENIPEHYFQRLEAEVRTYHASEDMQLLEKAYRTAALAHADQKRKSGEPFIIHPLQVALILAELHLDKETMAAALLHDTIEDTDISVETIEQEFGKEVLFLVEGVTKLKKTIQFEIEKDKLQRKEASLRKLLLATVEDVRVVIIKLADRLHNMRTLEFQKREKQIEIAEETMEIYVPIAGKLGIFQLKRELEELAFCYLWPKEYQTVQEQLAWRKKEDRKDIEEFIGEIEEMFAQINLRARVGVNYKNSYSIYQKMLTRECVMEEMYDIYSVSVILESFEQCYLAVGYLHNKYNPLPGRFKDFIALPKSNLYQAIHTTLISGQRKTIEVQIRTEEMEKTANIGILNYWKYSVGQSTKLEKMEWLRDILNWQKELEEENFTQFVKSRLSRQDKKIFCLTPHGESIALPYDSIVMDFAYQIHTRIGETIAYAMVNGKKVEPDTVLHNGERVRIVTGQRKKNFPYLWIEKTKTARARSKMLQFNRAQH